MDLNVTCRISSFVASTYTRSASGRPTALPQSCNLEEPCENPRLWLHDKHVPSREKERRQACSIPSSGRTNRVRNTSLRHPRGHRLPLQELLMRPRPGLDPAGSISLPS